MGFSDSARSLQGLDDQRSTKPCPSASEMSFPASGSEKTLFGTCDCKSGIVISFLPSMIIAGKYVARLGKVIIDKM